MSQQRDKQGNLPSRMILPRTPDKGSNPPTFHDWQAREMIAEARSKRQTGRKGRSSQRK